MKELDQHEGWREFFDLYWMFIYRSARRKGLNETEAEDVTQETMIRVAKALPNFEYDRKRGSFKGWLCRIVHNALVDLLRRKRISTVTLTDDGQVDEYKQEAELEAIWDEEWTRNHVDLALKGTRNRVSAREFQIFHLHVIQERPVKEVAQTAGVSNTRVYVVKLRVGRVFKQEYAKLKEDTR